MTGGFLDGDIFRGLAFRILLFLTLALLPFGLISVVQTRELAEQADTSARLSLIGLTERAAGAERAVIQQAFGAADALTTIIRAFVSDPETCSDVLYRYVAVEDRYSQIGFIGTDGVMSCTSARRVLDFSNDPVFTDVMLNPAQTVRLYLDPVISGEPVLVMFQPMYSQGDLLGFMTLSVPRAVIRNMSRAEPDDGLRDLVVFNERGEVLMSDSGYSEVDLPRDRALRALASDEPLVFSGDVPGGEERVFSVVPIVPQAVYSMAVWDAEDRLQGNSGFSRLSVFLPVLMWLASLVVAFWSINRLAIRHIRKLGRQMRLFAYNRRMPRKILGQGVPRELQEIQQSFVNMAGSIIRDEAALEDNIRDKNILLKEVHHRVKNNLQLISSIMNMQIRRAQSDDARFVLRRLQDRILSLATVHKNLYQTDQLDRVNAGALIEEIVGQLLAVGLPSGGGVTVRQDYDAVTMDADDAAPLTLAVSEAVTNALKYIGRPGPQTPAHLDISLRRSGDDEAVFSISNSTGDNRGSEGTGLGSQLITAFARQLNGHLDVSFEDGVHRFELRFPVIHRVKDAQDF